ncbi:FAD/NAD(P)-binding protein [Sphingomonas bacterium]|uniref:FAD/NAD(P)-binding protein n=1 Tax=Sphingomonas bacterium TaxID=1895847 RepID=UPI001575B966|nr:FAD/NAD(P)-binding protein [Sphingomonas bacterium]
MIRHVAIVGAGFAGTLQAINLLRHDGPRAVLIERTARPGRGVAYGAAHPSHLLNVRAGNMSAFPDDPGHFVRWLEARGVAEPAGSFVRRTVYGEYLEQLLTAARRDGADRLEVVSGDVVDVIVTDTVELRLADGGSITADAAVIAVGNLPPHDPPGLDAGALSSARYKADPWGSTTAEGLSDDDVVMVVGTGLTMVDVALMLDARGFRGRIVALSRRGLLPRQHEPPVAWSKLDERPPTVASALVRDLRTRAAAIGWRNAVDELRPFSQAMWANASDAERGRFLRHLRPWWDVHRHRLAPDVATRLAAMRDSGRLEVVAGKTLAFVERDDGIAVTWRPRGESAPRTTLVQRIVNGTGPQGNLSRTDEPLLRALVGRGCIRPDAAHLGIDVDPRAATVAADGTASERLFAIGPITRGAFWEIVAVPDIRGQCWDLARRLSNAHWVGGEGL